MCLTEKLHRLRLIPVVVFMVLLGACTTTTITPELVQPAQENIDAVVVTDITTDNELWELYLPHVRHGLVTNFRVRRIRKSDRRVIRAAPLSSVTVSGKLTEIDKGSTAARWIIGFGAGRAKARGTFEIKNPAGLVVSSSRAGRLIPAARVSAERASSTWTIWRSNWVKKPPVPSSAGHGVSRSSRRPRRRSNRCPGTGFPHRLGKS